MPRPVSEPTPAPPAAPRQRRWALLPVVLVGALVLLLLLVPLTSLLRMVQLPMAGPMSTAMPMPWAQQRAAAPLITPLDRQPALLRQGLAIRAGIHIENLYDLSLRDKTFSADGRIWLEWPQAVQDLLDQEELQPLQLVDFANQVVDWEGAITADTSRPIQRGDRWQQSYHFSKQFYLHSLNLHRYPFNDLNLPVVLQINPAQSELQGRLLLLLPQRNQRGIIGEYASVDGYQLQSAALEPQIRTYRTDYGQDRTVRVGQLMLSLQYRFSFWPAFVAYLLPLIIILVMVLISPYLEGSLGDVRIAIPSTALLTLVFLQQGYNAALPPSPYLTYLDRLYAVSYLICVALFVLFAWTSNVYQRTPKRRRAAVVRRLDVVDQYFQVGALAMLLVVSLEAWLY